MFPAFQTDSTRVVLDKLFVNGERHDSLTTLPFLDRITLKHTQSHFSFDVTAFDYSKSQSITYRYRLEGFDLKKSQKIWKDNTKWNLTIY